MSEFSEAVAEYLKHHTTRELADYCECIPSSVSRWATEAGTPLPSMQKAVIDYIAKIRKDEGW
jgi:hypothetical protein